MKKGNTLLSICKFIIGALVIMAGRVDATPYAFSVDQVLLSGNIPGFVQDEFDDGVIAPWVVQQGTALESDGVVILTNQGILRSELSGSYRITEEESQIFLKNNIGVEDGGGDFVTTSKWVSGAPGQNQIFSMRSHIDNSLGKELRNVTFGICNIGPLMADAFNVSTGLFIFFEENVTGIEMEYRQLFPITAEDITDSIMFSLYFDDSYDLFTGKYSLDGGATLHSPFAPIYTPMSEALFSGWKLDAVSYDVQTVPEPSISLLVVTGLACLGFFAKKKIAV